MKRKLGICGVGVALMLAGGGGAGALAADRPTTTPQNPERGGDQQIVMELHHANLNEIAMGKMAEQRATGKVKDYGATLVRDHKAADDKLLAYARAHNMNMEELSKPYDAMPHGAMAMTDLTMAKPSEFNHAFAQKMVGEHQKALDEAAASQKIARDPQLKALLAELTPTLRRHLATAESLVASQPQPPSQAVQRPGEPSGVSRTNTGVDTRPGVIP